VIMSRAGGSPTTHPHVKHLAIIAVVFVVMILAAILGPPWVGYFALPVMIVGVIYGAIVLARWMIKGPKRIVAYGVALVLLALVGGCYADMRTAVGPEETKRGCHADYYLRVIPVAFYCFD
jgi:energy-coupling factor transporter transmembrane protein EcfT